MLPRLPSTLLRTLPAGAALLVAILAAVAWPARHVLLPLWPTSVDEWLLADAGGGLEREFAAESVPGRDPSNMLARNRPISLWRVEMRSGQVIHSWLAGVRDAESGQLLAARPDWLGSRRIDGPLPTARLLVLMGEDGNYSEVESGAVARMFRPNELAWHERLDLALDRFREIWIWPLRPASEMRMAPPR